MFTLRKSSSKRASLSFLQSQNASDIQKNCSSLLIADDLPRENLIFLMLNPGCFREIMRCSSAVGTQCMHDSTASICNQICSLLVFSSREFSRNAYEIAERIRCSDNDLIVDHQITVLLDAPKVPMKALRIVLRACQSALAYKIRQCVLLEQDWFVQHRVALDVILREKYDFKVIVCPHSKLMNYIGLATLFDLQPIWREKSAEGSRQQRKSLLAGNWVDEKKAFSLFFAANPSYSLSMGSPSANISTASLLRLLRKDSTILIELVEHDLDSVIVSSTAPMPAVQQNQNQSLLQEKLSDFVEEKCQRKGRPSDRLSTVGRIRRGMPLIAERNSLAQRPQRHSLLSDGFSSSVTDLPIPGERLCNKIQGKDEFEFMCSSSVGSVIERNGGGSWPKEVRLLYYSQHIIKPAGDEFEPSSVSRIDASVRLLSDWIVKHGECRLTAMNESWKKLWTKFTGEIIYLDLIETERLRLSGETEEKLNEMANANDEMDQLERERQTNGFSEKPKELRTLGQFLHKAETQIYRLRNTLNAYKERIENARRFKETIEQFHKECDALILLIYNNDSFMKGRTLRLNEDQIKDRIKTIKERQNDIEKCVGLASETSSSFRFLLYQREMVGQNNKKGEDYAEEAVLRQISADSDALTKRRQRLAELVELWVRMPNETMDNDGHQQEG